MFNIKNFPELPYESLANQRSLQAKRLNRKAKVLRPDFKKNVCKGCLDFEGKAQIYNFPAKHIKQTKNE